MNLRHVSLLLLTGLLACPIHAQEFSQRPVAGRPAIPFAPQEANTDPAYKALRNIGTGEMLPAKELILKRDAGKFVLNGVLTFLAPVNGKVTGAVFFGKGTFELIPPIEVERKSLSQLTKEPALHEEFDQAVFR